MLEKIIPGWVGIRRKLVKLILFIIELISVCIAIPLVLLIRLIRPLFIIRIGALDIGRIGGIYFGDWYLSQKKYENEKSRNLDYFYLTDSTNAANEQWKKMWKHVLPILPENRIIKNIVSINNLIPSNRTHEISDIKTYPISNRQLISVLKNSKPNIFFTADEVVKGEMILKTIGIPENKSYVCFHSRDPAYLNAVYPNCNLNYHNYRDCNINNFVLAAEKLVSRGYFAVRMGAVVEQALEHSNHKVIDYATSVHRTDFNDIFIGSHCRFFISSECGISIIPELFRIPVVFVNKTLINDLHTYSLNGLYIFKKFFLKDENRYMTFTELMNFKFGGVDTNKIFSKMNLELIENTPEEIRAVAIEMDKRLNRTWETNKEDEELQQRFWDLIGQYKLRSPDLRIGAKYLRENKDFLE